jgi:hypothetical protein
VSDNPFHADRLYTLQVPRVLASVTATTTVSNNILEIVQMSVTERKAIRNVMMSITFTDLTSNGSVSVFPVMMTLYSHYDNVELHGAGLTINKTCLCLSWLSVTHGRRHVDMDTYHPWYNGATNENPKHT